MRIMHLSTFYPPLITGGAEVSVSMLAEATARAGHTVASVSTSQEAGGPNDRNGVTTYRIHHNTDFWFEEWPGRSKLENRARKFKQQFNFKVAQDFGAILDSFQPDIVHTHSMVDLSTLTWRAAAQRGIPIVHTLRDYDIPCVNSSLYRDKKKCKSIHLGCRAMTFTKYFNHKHVSAVVGVGREILQTHLDHGYFSHVAPELKRVIWNPVVVEGVDEGQRIAQQESETLTFGYIGRLTEEKGLFTLIEAAKEIKPRQSWKVVIAGNAVGGIEVFKEAASGCPIEFLGFVKPAEFFAQIDVLVVPSIWAEPLPRTILEAYALGIPVIGARSGGIPDLISEVSDDWLFEPGNKVELASKLEMSIDMGRQRFPGIDAYNGILEKTTPEAVVQNYLDIYQKVIGHRDSTRRAMGN